MAVNRMSEIYKGDGPDVDSMGSACLPPMMRTR